MPITSRWPASARWASIRKLPLYTRAKPQQEPAVSVQSGVQRMAAGLWAWPGMPRVLPMLWMPQRRGARSGVRSAAQVPFRVIRSMGPGAKSRQREAALCSVSGREEVLV